MEFLEPSNIPEYLQDEGSIPPQTSEYISINQINQIGNAFSVVFFLLLAISCLVFRIGYRQQQTADKQSRNEQIERLERIWKMSATRED